MCESQCHMHRQHHLPMHSTILDFLATTHAHYDVQIIKQTFWKQRRNGTHELFLVWSGARGRHYIRTNATCIKRCHSGLPRGAKYCTRMSIQTFKANSTTIPTIQATEVSMIINQSCTSFIFNKTLDCNTLPFGLLQVKKNTQKDKK